MRSTIFIFFDPCTLIMPKFFMDLTISCSALSTYPSATVYNSFCCFANFSKFLIIDSVRWFSLSYNSSRAMIASLPSLIKNPVTRRMSPIYYHRCLHQYYRRGTRRTVLVLWHVVDNMPASIKAGVYCTLCTHPAP